ncbi:MAG: glutamine--fructose-6-phosphate aminotransferase, partial [Dehalococcoidia bacterium]|nr:glutamine--fructose-6-phosphate aminotransferase [Dehalococcoidia bacterium]
MCGIVGYVGCREAQPILIDCLKRLEYRGYDSCGVALTGSKLSVHKDAVRIDALGKTLKPCASTSGIGHTRWATHGKPSQANAHPHSDCSGKIAVVHNGVINNYLHLRETLINEGHIFSSETDTEVIPHLIEKYYSGDLERAACQALNDLSGSYAVIVIHADCEHLVVARQGSPLIIGIGDKENLVASDVPAVLEYTDRVMYLEDGDFGVVGKDMVRLSNSSAPVTRQEHTVAWTVEQAQ